MRTAFVTAAVCVAFVCSGMIAASHDAETNNRNAALRHTMEVCQIACGYKTCASATLGETGLFYCVCNGPDASTELLVFK